MLSRSDNYLWGTHEPEVRAYLSLTGGGLPHASTRALNRFVRTGKRDGWWAKLADIYPFCGPSLAASLVKLKAAPGSPTTLTSTGFISSDYSEAAGFGQLGGTLNKYLQTGVTLSGLGLSNTNFSFGMFVCQTKADQPQSGFHLSTANAAADDFQISPNQSSTNGGGQVVGNVSASGISARVYTGGASSFHHVVNGVLTNRSTSTTVPSFTTTNEILIDTRRSGSFPGYGKHGMVFVGQALTIAEAQSLSLAMLKFDRTIRTGLPNASSQKWGFLGDSITFGSGATSTANQWSNKVCAARSKLEMNFGTPNSAVTFDRVGNAGYAVSFQNRLQDFMQHDFEKVFTVPGANDCVADTSTNGDPSPIATYQSGTAALLGLLAARYGAANVVVISPQWNQGKNTTHQQAWNAACSAAAAAAGVIFADYYTALTAQTTPSSFCFDNQHPNDAGHNLMASTVLSYV